MLGFRRQQRIFWGMPRGCMTSLWRIFREKPDLGYNQQLERYFSKGCAITTVHFGKKFLHKKCQSWPLLCEKNSKKFFDPFWGVLWVKKSKKWGCFLSFSSLSVHWCLSTEGRGLKITDKFRTHVLQHTCQVSKKNFKAKKSCEFIFKCTRRQKINNFYGHAALLFEHLYTSDHLR